MDQFDKMIAEALADDKTSPTDPGYFALAFSIFGGRSGWVSWVVMVVQSGLFLLAVWAGFRFFAATEVLAAVKWGISAAVLVILATQMKLSLMPVMQANRVLLELRRLELRLAQISQTR